MKNLKSDIKKLWARKKFLEIIKLIDKANPYYLDAELLVTKGISILCVINITEETTKYKLSDVKKLYEQAIKLDPEYFDAYQEMGYFHFVLNSDTKTAKQYFKSALDLKFQADIKHLEDLHFYTEENDSTRMRDEIFTKLNGHMKNLGNIAKVKAPKKAAKKTAAKSTKKKK